MHHAAGRIGCFALALALLACGQSDTKKSPLSVFDGSSARGTTSGARAAAGTTTATDTAAAKSADAAPRLATAWTDGSILAYSTVTSSGEAEIGRLGAEKATSSVLKADAAAIQADHNALLGEEQAAATRMQLAPDMKNATVQALVQQLNADLRVLSEQKPGTAWDRAFIDRQVTDEQTVLATLQDAAKHARTADLRIAVTNAATRVQGHLQKIKELRSTRAAS